MHIFVEPFFLYTLYSLLRRNVIRSWWWILWWLSTNWSIAAITLTSCGVMDENYLQLIRVLFRPTVFICWETDTRDISQVFIAPFALLLFVLLSPSMISNWAFPPSACTGNCGILRRRCRERRPLALSLVVFQVPCHSGCRLRYTDWGTKWTVRPTFLLLLPSWFRTRQLYYNLPSLSLVGFYCQKHPQE